MHNCIGVCTYMSFIGGGGGFDTCYSFIGGGQNNCIDTGSYLSAIGGGGGYCPTGAYVNLGNYIKGNHSFVGGGQANCIIGANCSTILGGCGNQVQSDFSVVLGGCNNHIPVGHQYVGVFGCNIATISDKAFHANTYVAQNMCDLTGGGPGPLMGTFYFCATAGPGSPCQVYIS